MSAETKTEDACCICEQNFRVEGLKEGKCVECTTKYPDAKSKKEVVMKGKPIKAKTLSEDRIREMIYEVLAEAGIEQKVCEKCGKAYFPKSPAAKQCEACRVKAVTASKAKAKDDKKDSK